MSDLLTLALCLIACAVLLPAAYAFGRGIEREQHAGCQHTADCERLTRNGVGG